MIVAQGGFFYSRNSVNHTFKGRIKSIPPSKVVNDELNRSPKGRRSLFVAVRPILFSSSPMIGL